jgi:hypothetical protein
MTRPGGAAMSVVTAPGSQVVPAALTNRAGFFLWSASTDQRRITITVSLVGTCVGVMRVWMVVIAAALVRLT